MKFSELENTKRQELLLLNEVLALVRPLDGKRYKQVSHDFAALNEAVKRVEKYAGLLPQDIQKYGEDDHGGIPRLSLTKIQARCTFVSQEIDDLVAIQSIQQARDYLDAFKVFKAASKALTDAANARATPIARLWAFLPIASFAHLPDIEF